MGNWRLAHKPPLAFRDVYAEHFAFVWRSLRRLGVREDDIADAVQEVFMVVDRRLAEFEGQAKLMTWIFRICVNVTRARRNSSYARHEVAASELIEAQAAAGKTPADLTEKREALLLLERALDRTPFNRRKVFVLFELEGLTCDQIADMFEIPLGTAYSRLRLARKDFHKAIRRAHREPTHVLAGGETRVNRDGCSTTRISCLGRSTRPATLVGAWSCPPDRGRNDGLERRHVTGRIGRPMICVRRKRRFQCVGPVRACCVLFQ